MIAGFVFIGAPAAVSTWWYIFCATPPYEWFIKHGFPTLPFSPLWIPVPVGLVLLFLIWKSPSKPSKRTDSGFAAVTFGDAIIAPADPYDGTELLRDMAKPTSARFSGITVSYNKDSLDCMWPTTFRWENQSEVRGSIGRLRVESDTESNVVQCKAAITSISAGYKTLVSGVQLPLLFTPAQDAGSDTKSVNHGQSEYLELLWIPKTGDVEIMTNFPFAFAEYKRLNRIADYSLNIAFSVDNIVQRLIIDAAYSSDVWMLSIRSPRPLEKHERNESRQLKARRDKLKNLLAKKERLATAESSPGFDMDAARRRNEQFIAEVRADITRLENEQS